MSTLEDYRGQKPAWCPGCGNFGILKAFKDAVIELGIEHISLPWSLELARLENFLTILSAIPLMAFTGGPCRLQQE